MHRDRSRCPATAGLAIRSVAADPERGIGPLPAPHPGGHPRERAELVNDQQPLRERGGPGGAVPTAMLTPSMDRKNSSSAHSMASMLVWTRMPGTLVSTSAPVLRSM